MHSTDTGSDDDAHPVAVLLRHVYPGIRDGLFRGHEPEMRVPVVAPGLLGVHQEVDVPVAHLRADLAGEERRVEVGDAVDADLAGDEPGPERAHVMADGGDGPQAGHDNAPR